MQYFKRIITWALVIIIAVAVVAIFRPRETVAIPDGLSILFWHPTRRCARCLKMENLLHESLHGYDDVQLFELEYDALANQSLARQFNVGTATIILVERRNGHNVRVRNLTTEVWENINDEDAFTAMLRKELEMFYD